MITINFHTDKPLPFLDKELGTHIGLLAGWTVEADTDDDHYRNTLPLHTEAAMNYVIFGYENKCGFNELSQELDEISAAVSEKLTAQSGFRCTAKLTELRPDERSAQFMKQRELAQKMSDPAYAAAELEKAMKKAQETAAKNGMSQQDIENLKNMPLPDLPPIPDDLDPIARAQAISARMEQMKQMAMNTSFAAAPAAQNAQSAPRPKFCAYCGSALPASGSFCPNCGAKI